jgi:hypothetical protein
MLVKGIEPWFPWFHTNVLSIKPSHHFDTKCIQDVLKKINDFFVNMYNNIWVLIFFISS